MRRLLLLLCLFAHLAAAQPPPGRVFLKQFGAAEGLPQPFIYALAQDAAGYLWMGTAEGLVRFDGTAFTTFTTREGLAEDFVTRLALEPGTGRLWVGHYQGGLSVSRGGGFRPVSGKAAAAGPLRPAAGIAPPDTAFREVGHLPSSPLKTPVPGPSFGFERVLPAGTVVQCVLPDREGNLWLGTAGQGLWRWSDRHVTFYPQPAVAGGPKVTSLLSGARASAGLSTGQWGRLRHGAAPSAPVAVFPDELLLPFAPTALLATPDERSRAVWDGHYPPRVPAAVWAGTTGHGLWQTPVPQKPSRQPFMRLVRRLPATVAITALSQHRNGDLWVGTALDGVYRLPADSARPAEHFTTANGLLHNTIYALTTDSAGQVWMGTHDTGLAVWRRGRFRYFRYSKGIVNVSALLTDDVGRVWIGTEGQGVFRFQHNRFTHYTPARGLATPYCYALLPVRWGSSYHGGYRHDFRKEQVVAVHRDALSFLGKNGEFRSATLPANPLVHDLLPQAAVAWDEYALWVLTRTGLLRLRTDAPDLLPANQPPVPRLLASAVDGAARPPYGLGELSAGRHRVSFRFRGVSLRPGAADLQYQYRLRGYQNEWSQPSATGEAQFPRLDAGRFMLEVRARLGQYGAWSAPAATPFSVATPFWQTAWFAVLSVATAVVGIWGFTRTRTATLRRQKRQLEATVQERTADLRRQKAETEQTNAELVVARDAAEASRRAKAQFLANMSHEIRTPMNAVIGLSHLLRNTPINGEQQEYLEAIQSSSQNLLVIINDILDSSKMEAGKLTLEQAPLRLPELVERVARMFRFATESKGLYFRTEIGPEVPAAILGDPVRLNQVLVNLVGNAVKFTTRGGVTLRLEAVATADASATLRFGVRDTGIGIAADKLDAIFEDFSQANASTTRQFGGTGLGLSIARNLVQLHGGRLWVESTEGEGSTFWFEIPARPADPATVPPEAALVLPPFAPPLRVLVAEDNLLNQLVARKTLEAWNVRVTVADNGRRAVEAAQQQAFDAVLLDVQMPEMDGYEAARQLRALFPDPQRLPLIGLTASALPEDRVLALEAGMNDTLAKPFDPAVLYARLAHYTGRTPAPTAVPAAGGAAPDGSAPPAPAAASAPAEDPPERPDWTLLEELAGGNEAFVQQIVRTFLAQAPVLAAELPATQGPALAQVAHKLRGQVAYFGLPTLTRQLETVEQTARQQPADAALPPLLISIQQALRQVYPLLECRLPEARP
ncbi:hybrid sensor histidine kinase/response regulator [Hymenobacter rubripertinctus]|uniref:histidine kinase n=1 Tax=Hymenobacter rubripertinctus TaxID=2029981 RepID=A0A418QJI2_9BACT|nr:hybrid sensor histidine kinase/response regulator [Hymenobacter rubripertinctus]RIY05347.1 hybrid sensor histidine kinase/response regulator [Hymenobacter rubripertinctus]